MKIAAIADIHANIFALEAVLNDIQTEKCDQIICLGDLVGYATFPNEVIDLIRSKAILTIQGNYDESVGENRLVCGCDYSDPHQQENAVKSLNWTKLKVTSENKDWLKALPKEVRLSVEGKELFFVHGSPRQNNEYLYKDSEALSEILADYVFDVLVCGHTHKPYIKACDGRYIVNAGSAGKPKHGRPDATYVIIDVRSEGISFITREVPYDYEKTATAIEQEAGLPTEFADLFRQGHG